MDTQNSKSWKESRTIWFNIIVAMLTVLCAGIELLRERLPPEWYLVISMLAAAGNVWLRTVTTTSLGGKS